MLPYIFSLKMGNVYFVWVLYGLQIPNYGIILFLGTNFVYCLMYI